jgi:hypothetical protein
MANFPFPQITTQHDPTQCTISEGHPCPACSNLIAVDKEISLLRGEATNEPLVEKRRMIIESDINKYHDILFHNLPLEIIALIFRCYVDQTITPLFIGDWQTSDNEPSYAPFVLGGVSKAWREAVWATSALWSSLHVEVRPDKQPPVQLTREWLSRSGQLPLCIRVDCTGMSESQILDSFLDLLRGYAHRWRILFLGIHPYYYPRLFDGLDGAPALEILRLLPEGQSSGDPPFTLHNTPRLRDVQLSDIYVKKVCIEWHTLTHLKVTNLSNEELRSILQLAKGLIKCEACLVDGDEPTFPVLTLPSLQQFIFLPRGHVSGGTILDRLIFPALTDFTYDSSTSAALAPIDKFLAFLEHSRAGITHLTFTGITNEDHITDTNFVQLLVNLPLITHLSTSIRESRSGEDGFLGPLSAADYLLDALSSLPKRRPSIVPGDNFLPRLQVLHLTRATISWQALLHIFDSHGVENDLAEAGLPVDIPTATPANGSSRSARRPLREVRLFLNARSSIYIEESVLLPLFRVRESGIQLKIKNQRTGADLFQASSEFYSQRNRVSTTFVIVKAIVTRPELGIGSTQALKCSSNKH